MECRKHDHHNHGVCPSCLRERLYSLPATNNVPSYYVNSVSSPSPPSSSSSTAGDAFPSRTLAVVGGRHHHKRVGSMSSAVGKALNGNHNSNNNIFDVGEGLKKSRSMAFGPRDYSFRETKSSGLLGKKKNKKNKAAAVMKLGFWTKLLSFRGKAGGSDEGLAHVRQRLHY